MNKCRLFFSLFVFGLLVIQNSTFGQQPYFKQFGVSSGIPSVNIYDLHFSANEFLYLGTDQGLFYYDGINFKKCDFVESLAVGVNGIFEDEKGTIWCKNFSNQIFYLSGNKLMLEKRSAKFLNESSSNLMDFTVFENQIYLLTEKQVVQINHSGSSKVLNQIQPNSAESFTSLELNKQLKTLFVASTSKSISIDLLNGKLTEKRTLTEGQVELTQFQNKTYHVIRSSTKDLFDNEMNFFKVSDEVKGGFIQSCVAKNKLWLCTTSGVYWLDTENLRVGKPLLFSVKTTDIVGDHEGNLWVSSIGQGLFFIPDENLVKLSNGNVNKHDFTNFTCISKSPNKHLFVGTDKGQILEYDEFGNHIITYHALDDKEIEFVKIEDKYLITSNGTFNIGNSKVQFSHYLGKGICSDSFGNILLASSNMCGIIPKTIGHDLNLPDFLNTKHYQTTLYGTYNQPLLILKNKRTRAVFFEDKSKSYYCGGSEGLFVFSEKYDSAFEIRDKQNKPIIASQIVGDEDGSLWIATIQQGLYKIVDDKVVKHLNFEHGLPNNQCKKLRITKDGIWLITDSGLHFIQKKTFQIKQVSTNSGFDDLMINDLEILNNKIFLATNEGVLVAKLNEITREQKPIFEIQEVRSGNSHLTDGEILAYRNNGISIKFRAIHYRSMGKYRFYYRLLGLDDQWISQDSKVQDLNFFSLKPGTYTFEAKMIVGDYISPIQRFRFSVENPFWLNYWFVILIVIALFLILYTLYNWQIGKIQKRQDIKEQLALSQITALRAQMNPHFMFNILNAFQGLIYTNQKTKANEYLGVFSDLMRKTLDISDQREISIAEELEAIELYVQLEKARFEEGDFEFELLINEHDELSKFSIPSLILQPFIENAIKHGLLHKSGVKKLKLEINKEAKTWIFVIEDNGIGRKKSMERNEKFQKHKSFATQSIATRIDLINKLNNQKIMVEIVDLMDQNKEAKGTRVILKLPINQILK